MLNFNTGLSALRSSQVAMDVLANNIANANTPEYHRQSVSLVDNIPVFDGNFWMGTGVSVASINRIASRAVEAAFTTSLSDLGRVDQSLILNRQLESSIAPSAGSIQQRLQDFFGEAQTLQGIPENPAQRQVFLNRAQSLANEFNSISADVNRLRNDTRAEIEATVDQLNGQLETLSRLNKQIKRAEATGRQPNDLLDAHQQLVNEIAQSIDIQLIPQSSGFAYQFANDRVSVTQSTFAVEARFDAQGQVSFFEPGSEFELPFAGGSLAGYQQVLNDSIPVFTGQLESLSSTLIQAVDQIQATGIGLSGGLQSVTSHRPVRNTSIPLVDAQTAFDVSGGELFVSVSDSQTGERVLHRLNIDPRTQSLEDIATALSGLDHLQATVDSTAGTLNIRAENGFEFDFAGRLPTEPDRTSITGDAPIELSGRYSGPGNEEFQFNIVGTGQIGVAEPLTLSVTNSAGALVGEFNIGAGYEPGSVIKLDGGIDLRIQSGLLNDGDRFIVDAVSEPDTGGLLVALGINTLFQGTNPGNLRVNQSLVADPNLLAVARSGNPGDATNIDRLVQFREQEIFPGDLNAEDYLASITTSVAIHVRELTTQQSDLTSWHNNLQQERSAISGVDPNEELVQMLQYQRAFQAATRVITTIDETLNEVINMAR